LKSGTLEVVPNAVSRDQLGKKVDGGLYEYFLDKYGPPTSDAFQQVFILTIVKGFNKSYQARKNFIKSMAAYSVVCYILQIKDRHNGNILIDEEGHLIHIGRKCIRILLCNINLDFGFIFDTSPGGDFGFEIAPFKLSAEMIEIMGGRPDAEPFKWFMVLSTRAFLAARFLLFQFWILTSFRQYTASIVTLVQLMLDTGLPCFKGETIERLLSRLIPNRTEKAAGIKFFENYIAN
jgi:phosphatidylinositol 4-kinase